MASTVTAFDPLTGERSVIVEVHSDLTSVPPQVRREFAERLFRRNVRVGMVVTPVKILVLRDTLSSMEFNDNKYELTELETGALFEHAKAGPPARQADALKAQVVRWLEAVGTSWYSFLHPSAVPALVPDVVGGLVDANLDVWDGLLDRHDAAE